MNDLEPILQMKQIQQGRCKNLSDLKLMVYFAKSYFDTFINKLAAARQLKIKNVQY